MYGGDEVCIILSPDGRTLYNYPMATRFLLIILMALLCSCQDTSDLAPIAPGGELIMLTRNTPTTYYFEGDNEAGLDYELAQAFA